LLELHLTVEDLARIRIAGTLGPAFETHFAWSRLAGSQRDLFAAWRRMTLLKLHRLAVPNSALKPASTLLEALLSPSPGEDEIFPSVAIEPFWDRILHCLKAERDACGRAMLTGGMEEALNSRHTSIRWQAPVLRIETHQPNRQARLTGQGMTLAPSLFAPHPFLIDSHMGWSGLPILVYNVTPAPEAAESMWQGQEGESALRALLGRTRADVLGSLRETRSTGEIADRLQISNPSASKHLTVLRRAGFVTTERRQNSAVHSLTPLGEAILD
jgi:Helix-turn-helix domain